MTGTPPRIGCMRDQKVVLRHGDDMRMYNERIGKIFFYRERIGDEKAADNERAWDPGCPSMKYMSLKLWLKQSHRRISLAYIDFIILWTYYNRVSDRLNT
jgi:hypothetical protein